MDRRTPFRSTHAPTTSAISPKRQSRRPWRLYTFIGLVVCLCVMMIIADFWLVEEYIAGTRVLVTQKYETEPSSWSHLTFYAANHKHIKMANKTIHNINKGPQTANTCQMPVFYPESKADKYGSCKQRTPIEDSCEEAQKMFLSHPKFTCNHQQKLQICQLHKDNHVSCSKDACQFDISLGLIDENDGTIAWKTFTNTTSLEFTIEDLLKTNSSGGNYGFCFIKCKEALRYKPHGSQILLLPQYYSPNTFDDGTSKDAININVMWLDSTSHTHFFRSMPKSLKILTNAKKNKLLNVYNYDLMQSMDGGTFVNAIALTKGDRHTGIGNLFKLFQDGGYHVTYLDDLCWTNMLQNRVIGIPLLFGMPKSEGFHGRVNTTKAWRYMQDVLAERGVDQIGISLANCNTITGLKNIFLEKAKEPVCFNGQFYTDYIFDYLISLQTQLQKAQKPYFNYFDLNACHEPTGRRCQTLDDSLAKLVSHLTAQKNTITFLFGDHGLAYGPFLKATREGYYETAHPVSFILASKDLDAKLGKDKMEALSENQERLMDIIDIRQTIYSLSPVIDNYTFQVESKYDNHPKGLFYPINPQRTCETLGIKLESNKCVCDEDQPSQKTSNGTRVNLLAEYALGEINNMIQEQFVSLNRNGNSRFGSCQRLHGTWINNVHEKVIDNVTTTEMEIYLPAGASAPQTEDSFYVTVKVDSNSSPGSSIEMVYYLRISSHGVYDECRDDGVDRKLCVCSPSNRSMSIRQWHLQPPKVFGTVTAVVSLNNHLFIYERRSEDGVVLEASCDDEQNIASTFKAMVITSHKKNIVSSKDSPLTVIIKSGMKVFLDVFYRLDSSKKWELEYEVSYIQLA